MDDYLKNMMPSLEVMERLEADLLLRGISIVYGGKRIDPSDFYISKEEWEARQAPGEDHGG